MKIVLTQFWTEEIPYSQYTKAINEKYCKEHGYIYHVETNSEKIKNKINDRSITWYKPFLLMETIEKYDPDYILFLDADAIVVENSYKIEDFIIPKKEIVVTEDYGPSEMNAGVILLKNTEWVKTFLKTWYDVCDDLEGGDPPKRGYYKGGLWHDQTCFSYLLLNNFDCKEKIAVIENKILNCRIFKDVINKNFIFHAFSYGEHKNRTLDEAYYKIFDVPPKNKKELLDIIQYYSLDKHHTHDYFNLIYNDLFKSFKETCKIFVELGVFQGESLKLWSDYFVNSKVIGCDIDLELARENLTANDLKKINLQNLNLSDPTDLEKFSKIYKNVDIILDDGSHKMSDQQITFAKLFKTLKSGGIYIIEDLHTSLEAIMPEKKIFNWGDPNKTLTLNMLKKYVKDKKIISDYMSEEEMDYLNKNILSVEIYQSKPFSITSVIRKK